MKNIPVAAILPALFLVCAGAFADEPAAPPPELAAAKEKYEAELAAADKKGDEALLAELAKLKKKAMADGKLELALFYENAAKNLDAEPDHPPREWTAAKSAADEALGKTLADIHKRHIADLVKMRDRKTASGLLEQAVAVDAEIKETRQALGEAAPTAAGIRQKLTGQTWAWDKEATLVFKDNGVADYAYTHNNYEWRKGGRKVPAHQQLVSTDKVNRKFSWAVDNPKKRLVKCSGDGHAYSLVLAPLLTTADVYEGDRKLRRISLVREAKAAAPAPPVPELAAAERIAAAALAKVSKKLAEECLAELAGLKKKAMAAGNLALALAVDGEIKSAKDAPASVPAADGTPPELLALRERHRQAVAAAIQTIRESQAAELARARKKAMAALDLDAAVAFDRRLKEIQTELAGAVKTEDKPTNPTQSQEK